MTNEASLPACACGCLWSRALVVWSNDSLNRCGTTMRVLEAAVSWEQLVVVRAGAALVWVAVCGGQ